MSEPRVESPKTDVSLERRALMLGAATVATGMVAAYMASPLIKRTLGQMQPVFLAANQRYDGPLEQTIADGLIATGLDPAGLRGRKVLLKPNMVEPRRDAPHMTTNPAMVRAVAGVFRRWGATVKVGEAPGHVRDTEMALVESRIEDAILDAKLEFADLNYQEVGWRANAGQVSKLPGFYFPSAVLEADLIVSLPKLKTHHWVGMTAALKNMYGTLPGVVYGWPKNVLHHAGIPQTVVDINASLPRTIGIIDGIECMEGDGPIMGSPKHLGIVAIGTNLPALDATCARVIGLNPAQISYLALADGKLGSIADSSIEQRGERWEKLQQPFELIDAPHLRNLRLEGTGALKS
jgi:uncharacterized protein (DUF362 family)